MINEGRMDLFWQVVFNMIIALGMPAIDDDELDDLTLRTGHAGKLWESTNIQSSSWYSTVQNHLVEIKGEACLKSCSLIFQEDEDDVSSQKTPPQTPPSTDTVLRTSNRRLGTKRTYVGMQSRRGGSRKKFKCTIKELDDFRDTTDVSTNGDAATNGPAEVNKEPDNDATSAGFHHIPPQASALRCRYFWAAEGSLSWAGWTLIPRWLQHDWKAAFHSSLWSCVVQSKTLHLPDLSLGCDDLIQGECWKISRNQRYLSIL